MPPQLFLILVGSLHSLPHDRDAQMSLFSRVQGGNTSSGSPWRLRRDAHPPHTPHLVEESRENKPAQDRAACPAGHEGIGCVGLCALEATMTDVSWGGREGAQLDI